MGGGGGGGEGGGRSGWRKLAGIGSHVEVGGMIAGWGLEKSNVFRARTRSRKSASLLVRHDEIF